MTDIINRYPLSTPNGMAIPLDIIKPIALLRIDFNTSSFVAAIDLSAIYANKIFVATSNQDCYLHVGDTPASPVSGTALPDVIYIPAGVTLAFVTDSLQIAAIGITNSGRVDIQICETWAGLAIEAQVNKI